MITILQYLSNYKLALPILNMKIIFQIKFGFRDFGNLVETC